MIKADQIKSKEVVLYILENLKPYEKYISTLSENSWEYENCCDKVHDYLLEIEEALFGYDFITPSTLANCNIRMFTYWKYLKGNMKPEKLFKELKNIVQNN